MVAIAIFVAAVLLGINMGASGLASAFAPSLGAKVLGRRHALALYGASVLVGALLFGGRVSATLGKSIAPAAAFTPGVTLVVLVAVGLAMLAANLLRIPQSTSWVTVASVVVVGLFAGEVQSDTVYGRLVPAWVLLPIASHIVTYLLLRPLYPLRPQNLRLHERLKRHRKAIRALVLASGVYVAVAIGANNVANVVGPVAASGVAEPLTGVLLVAPTFAIGATLFAGPAETMARGIVPIGEVTACVCGLVVGTLLLSASFIGIPQSLVQLQAAAVLAVSRVKEEAYAGMPTRELARIGAVWLGAPIVAALLTRALLEVTR